MLMEDITAGETCLSRDVALKMWDFHAHYIPNTSIYLPIYGDMSQLKPEAPLGAKCSDIVYRTRLK